MIVENGKYYLYRHIRLDTNTPFYVGIGTKRNRSIINHNSYERANSKNNRSGLWSNIANKTEISVDILFETDDYNFLKHKEIEFIKLYGRRDLGEGPLVNFTNGGDGVRGKPLSEDHKRKISISNTGKVCSASTRSKIGAANTGRVLTESVKNKMSVSRTGIFLSKDTKTKMSISAKGKIKSERHRINLGLSRFPLEKRVKIKEMWELNYSKESIIRTLKTSRVAIDIVIKEFNLAKIRYRLERSDGMRFYKETDACAYMGLQKGTISNSISRKMRAGNYYWKNLILG